MTDQNMKTAVAAVNRLADSALQCTRVLTNENIRLRAENERLRAEVHRRPGGCCCGHEEAP
ncbi:hypothetical protein FK268_12790 [Tsukamurella sputi]|uniref:Uncharacterized protein n=1 Tax=Tsukamurella sputi TaxID=2591848 RepID=A0A5C5RKF9_9ACTN|nr:hypothetical protein [Tsukamurella sputi]TWS23190.1 hypothetical protein FK268_12790 [Tsukamurella sputi]